MKKWIFAATLAVVLVMGLTACGSQGGGSTASQPAATSSAKDPAAAPAQKETQTPAAPAAPAATAQEITADEAKSIALKDAGFAESEVTMTKVEKDIDNGITKYEIEFVNGDTEYSYDIKIDTGEILKKETDSVYDD